MLSDIKPLSTPGKTWCGAGAVLHPGRLLLQFCRVSNISYVFCFKWFSWFTQIKKETTVLPSLDNLPQQRRLCSYWNFGRHSATTNNNSRKGVPQTAKKNAKFFMLPPGDSVTTAVYSDRRRLKCLYVPIVRLRICQTSLREVYEMDLKQQGDLQCYCLKSDSFILEV